MTLLSSQRQAAYLASGAGFAAILSSGEIPTAIGAFALAAFLLSYLVGERTAGRATVVWTVGIIGAFAYLAVAALTGAVDIVIATSIFAMVIALHRLYNRRGVRDYALVHLTALLMIAGGSALSAELAFGVSFLVFAVSATWSLTLTYLRQEIEEEAAQNRVPDGGASVLADRRLVSPRLLGVLGALAIAALTMALLVFALFPRVSFGLWRRPTPGGAHTGFSDAVDLGGRGLIKDDPRVAFRVRLDGGKAGNRLGLYWRGATFDSYDGHGWRRTLGPARPLSYPGENGWYPLAPRSQRATDEYDISLDPGTTTDALFVTGRPTAVQMLPEQVALRTLDAPRLLRNPAGDLIYVGGRTSFVHYRLRTARAFEGNLRGLGQAYPPEIRRLYLALPPLDPRIARLAQRLTRGRDPVDAASAVEAYFRTFHYTLALEAHGQDRLASFLFDVKAGHCEYFATAMAVLLRAAGVPSRVASGFYGGRYVARGNYYAVRDGDAHAWVEAYFPTQGWVTFDPTPAVDREALLGNAYAAFELWLDGVRTAWRTRVVEYDLEAQLRGLKSAMELMHGAGARLGAAGAELSRWPMGRILGALFALCALGLAAFTLSRRRPRAPIRHRTADQARASAVYRELVRRLSRRGLAAGPSLTARELASMARARGLEQADAVSRIVERYLATRYGDVPLAPAEAAQLSREVRRL